MPDKHGISPVTIPRRIKKGIEQASLNASNASFNGFG